MVKTKARVKAKHARCEGCMARFLKDELHPSRGEFVCFACLTARVVVPKMPRPKKDWYVVAVLSGQERKVRARIKRRTRIDELDKLVGRILFPRQKCVEMLYSGERVTRNRKKYPGYLLAEIAYCPDTHNLVRGTEGVMGFMPFYDRDLLKYDTEGHKVDEPEIPPPTPLKPDEVKFLLLVEKAARKKDAIKVDVGFKPGDKVQVRDGAFSNNDGIVQSVSGNGTARPIVKVECKVWGHPVVLDLEPWQVRAP